jgi:hypothetical protein
MCQRTPIQLSIWIFIFCFCIYEAKGQRDINLEFLVGIDTQTVNENIDRFILQRGELIDSSRNDIKIPNCHVFSVDSFLRVSAPYPKASHIRGYLGLKKGTDGQFHLVLLMVPVIKKEGGVYKDTLPAIVAIQPAFVVGIYNFSCPCPPHDCCDPGSPFYRGSPPFLNKPEYEITTDTVLPKTAIEWIKELNKAKTADVPVYFIFPSTIEKKWEDYFFRLYHTIDQNGNWTLVWAYAKEGRKGIFSYKRIRNIGAPLFEAAVTDISNPETIDSTSYLWQASQ